MADTDESEPPGPIACALCGTLDTFVLGELVDPLGATVRVAFCSECYAKKLTLRQP
jgi:hypothetical protein